MGLSLFFLNHLTNVLSLSLYIYTYICVCVCVCVCVYTTSTLNAYFVQEKISNMFIHLN